jgi:pyridoxamine 5'-phosphate oxidase
MSSPLQHPNSESQFESRKTQTVQQYPYSPILQLSNLAARTTSRLTHLLHHTMSTSHPTPTTPAPWKPLFVSHIEKVGGASVEFSLATVTDTGLPRVRTCIHRGFWASLPENPHNKLPQNPKVYESDCPTFTTDARMNKAFDIFATGKGKGNREQSRSGTGGGGPVEAMYWVKDVMTQWRIRGKCWVISADDVEGRTDAVQNSGTVSMKAEVGRYMRRVDGNNGSDEDWSYRREVVNHFENLSPMMRGTFKNPPPGEPVDDKSKVGKGEKLGQQAGSLEDEDLARSNFRVVVITPEEVEAVDVSDPSASKRWIWTIAEESGGHRGGDSSS